MTTLFANFKAPGTRVVESTQGYRALDLVSHQTAYMVGSGEEGDYNTPTQVLSVEDFTNVFGASPSTDSVRLFFRNDPEGILFFTRTQIATRKLVTISTAATGAYTLTINGTAVTYTATGSPTLASIASGLLAAVNSSAVGSAVTARVGLGTDSIYISADIPSATLTVVSTTGNTVTTAATPTSPTSYDYVYTIEHSFDYEDAWNQGFLLAPEAFQTLATQSDRLSVGLAMETLVSSDRYDWVSIVDVGDGLTLNEASIEGLLHPSPQGHTWFYYPYVISLEDVEVPPSAGVAGIASRRYKTEGFQQPAAGAKFPLLGVKDVVTKVSSVEQEVVNPQGINVVRNLRNKGVVIWGMRTRSDNEFYRFGHVRVIMNVLNGSLRKGFDNDLFSVVDGFGVYLNSIAQTANSLCRRLWKGKALFGGSEAEAFEVKCDFDNNTPEELENGNVLVEVYVVPSPAAERILINTIRVSIGYLPLTTTI
jgi:hypothetical protein